MDAWGGSQYRALGAGMGRAGEEVWDPHRAMLRSVLSDERGDWDRALGFRTNLYQFHLLSLRVCEQACLCFQGLTLFFFK